MKIAVVSANLGGFDKPVKHEKQSVDCDFYHITDKEYPLRDKSMTPRLQARIVKMFMWQFAPDYDIYLWVDSSCRLSSKDSVQWFLDQLGAKDMAVFKHPDRKTVEEEADYLEERLAKKCTYITPRYENEDIDGQLGVVDPNLPLYASTAFICRNNFQVRDMLTLWWLHTSRYHSIDQLSLPKVMYDSGIKFEVIKDNYLKIPYLEYMRNK